jgi:signal transduction histidine kinase
MQPGADPGIATQEPARVPRRFLVWLVMGNVFVMVVLVGMAALSLHWSRQSMADRAVVNTENLARAMQQNIVSTLDRVDLALQAIRQVYEARSQHGPIDPAEINAILTRLDTLLGDQIQLRIADAEGRVRYGVDLPQGAAINVSDRPYFAFARDQADAGLVVSEPLRSRVSGRWVLAVVRRLNLPDGRFAGIVYGSLDVDYFQRMFAAVELGQYGAISLRSTSLRLVARHTAQGPETHGIGTDNVSAELLQRLRAAPLGGSYVARSAFDQVERSNAYLRVGSYPLLVLVGLATTDYLAPWRVQRAEVSSLVLMVVLLMGTGSLLAYRHWQREALGNRIGAREQAQRVAAEREAELLRARVEERDEFVRVLAHEVRQPLNNASAALQGARAVLLESPGGTAAAQRVRRAETVIRQIVGTLDNTLAAAALLASPERIYGADADVATLIELSLGDLDIAARPRVQVERVAATRTASMDTSLMRLALRNVLGNALAYSPPDSTVRLRVTDSDDPLALVFEVFDHGIGVPEELRPRLFERGVRGTQHQIAGHGIGLYVVRRVMELHGGRVDLRPNEPVGTVFRLWLPQDR